MPKGHPHRLDNRLGYGGQRQTAKAAPALPLAGAQRAGAAQHKCTREPQDAREREAADDDAAFDATDRTRQAIGVAAAVFFTRAALVKG